MGHTAQPSTPCLARQTQWFWDPVAVLILRISLVEWSATI